MRRRVIAAVSVLRELFGTRRTQESSMSLVVVSDPPLTAFQKAQIDGIRRSMEGKGFGSLQRESQILAVLYRVSSPLIVLMVLAI